jgi:hypothetical protein
MRLAVATAILSQGLPVLSSDRIINDGVRGTNWQMIESHHVSNTIQEPWPTFTKTRQVRHLRALMELRKRLEEVYIAVSADGGQECDPEELDADIGVLSCGIGRYCVESEQSMTGGFCVTSPDEVDRGLQEEDGGLILIDGIFTAFCADEANKSYCACEVDRDNYLLYVSCVDNTGKYCIEYSSSCGANITTCHLYDLSINVTAPLESSRRICVQYTEPYEQKVCYESNRFNGSITDTCNFEVEGVTCNSCQILEPVDNSSLPCYEFDCTNTIASSSGYWLCDEGVLVAPIVNYLATYGCDYYVCPICGGDDFVSTNPGGLIELDDGTTTCAAVAQAALLGAFNETFCQEVVIPGVAEDCGCIPAGMETPSAGVTPSAPSTLPTESDMVPPMPSSTPPVDTEAPAAAPSGSAVAIDTRMAATVVGLSVIALM